MATRISDLLFLGSALDAGHLIFSNPQRIAVVVNVALEPDSPINGVVNVHVPMLDGDISADSFDLALRAIAVHVNAGRRVLVHCLMGVSRSVTVVALYLARTEGLQFKEALKRVKKLRVQADPAPEAVSSAVRYLSQRYQRRKPHGRL